MFCRDQDYKVLLEVLCEICFEVAKKCMYNENNLFIRLGAFYMLYGLYYKQPVRFVKMNVLLNIRFNISFQRNGENSSYSGRIQGNKTSYDRND